MSYIGSFFKNNLTKFKSRLSISKVYTYLLYLLFFLYGLNFLILDNIIFFLIIAITVVKMLLCQEIRINRGITIVVLFSFFFTVFYLLGAYRNGTAFSLSSMLRFVSYFFIFPIGAYLIGSNLIKTYRNKYQFIINILLAI